MISSTQILDQYMNSLFFLPLVLFMGIVAGIYSCSLLEVPFLASTVSVTSKGKKEAFFKSLFFVLGLICSYIVIGLFFGQLAKMFSRFALLTFGLFILIGIIAIIWGLTIIFSGHNCGCFHSHNTCSTDTSCNNSSEQRGFFSRFKIFNNPDSFFKIFLVGNLFAWIETPVCPCCGPIIYVLSALTIVKGKILLGISAFALYSIGQGIPVIIICVFLTHFVNRPGFLKSKQYFNLLMGNILVFLGVLFLWIA